MGLVQAAFVVAILGLMMIGFGQLSADFTERRSHETAIVAIATAQNAIYRWYADERQTLDTVGFARPEGSATIDETVAICTAAATPYAWCTGAGTGTLPSPPPPQKATVADCDDNQDPYTWCSGAGTGTLPTPAPNRILTTAKAVEPLRNLMPVDPLGSDPVDVSAITGGSNIDPAESLVFANLDLGGSGTLSLHWDAAADNTHIEMRLHGDWTERHRHEIHSAFPQVIAEDRITGGVLPDMPTDIAALTNSPMTLRLDLPHPSAQAVLQSSMRRFVTEDAGVAQGMIAPLIYDEIAEVETNQDCGTVGAITVDDIGVLMVCADEDGDATCPAPPAVCRRWRPMLATHFYCRDTRILPGDPLYTMNAPNTLPIIDVDWTDVTPPTTAASVLQINPVQVGTNLVCPTGFTLNADDLCQRN